jgi:hypothetical protein
MLESKRDKIERATQTAKDKFARATEREAEFRRQRQKVSDADSVKTARLRALRLAKEAADKETEAREAAEKAATKPKRRAVSL